MNPSATAHTPAPYYVSPCGRVTLYHGDCLDVLRSLGAGSIDAIIADPPYGINTKSDGSGKINPWGDLCNSALWYREWIGQSRSIIKPSGCLWSCLNWRSLVTFQKASCDLGWPIESLLVWDKCWIGPGGQKGLRPSYELVALWAGAEFAIPDRGLPDVQRFKWSSHKPTGHPAEKPVALMQWLMEISTPSDGLVLDPFAGSGTTAIAALRTGRRCILIEQSEAYCQIIAERVKNEVAQVGLF